MSRKFAKLIRFFWDYGYYRRMSLFIKDMAPSQHDPSWLKGEVLKEVRATLIKSTDVIAAVDKHGMTMKQQTLAMAENHETVFEQYRRPTRHDEFLDTMNRIVPWAELCAVIEPHDPKRGNGRPPIGLEHMLRIHFIQHWFNLAKNVGRAFTALALANIYLSRNRLLARCAHSGQMAGQIPDE